jgi:hypothetical protein
MPSSLVSQLAVMLKTEMENSPMFPFDTGKDVLGKPNGRPFTKPHMKTLALKNNPIMVISPTLQTFELGNEQAEEKAPRYHILENAKIIRKRGRGTPSSKGSQANIMPKNKRDYGIQEYDFAKKKLVQEYRTSFGDGKRSYQSQTNRLVNKRYETRGKQLNYYYNVHWAYIERILEQITPTIADFLGAKLVKGEMQEKPIFEQIADMQDVAFAGGIE